MSRLIKRENNEGVCYEGDYCGGNDDKGRGFGRILYVVDW